MYVGLSEALPPTKDCNDRTIEFQNKLGPGKILGYSCDWATRRNFPRNGTLKFNEKYVYDGQSRAHLINFGALAQAPSRISLFWSLHNHKSYNQYMII